MRVVFWMGCWAALLALGCSAEPPVEQPAAADVAVEAADAAAVEDADNAVEGAADAAMEDADDAEGPLIVDVRSQEEWDSGHLPQAVHIPHTEIVERIGEHTEDKGAEIVLYCKSGGRAGRAKEALEAAGFTNVENAGGYDDIKARYEGAP